MANRSAIVASVAIALGVFSIFVPVMWEGHWSKAFSNEGFQKYQLWFVLGPFVALAAAGYLIMGYSCQDFGQYRG